jgi:hypothetical protein
VGGGRWLAGGCRRSASGGSELESPPRSQGALAGSAIPPAVSSEAFQSFLVFVALFDSFKAVSTSVYCGRQRASLVKITAGPEKS